MVCGGSSRHWLPSWMSAASRVDFDGKLSLAAPSSSSSDRPPSSSDATVGFAERALSAGGAAVISAIIVNPLDVAKTRLQAQAAGASRNCSEQQIFGRHMASLGPNTLFSDFRCSPSCARAGAFGAATLCPPDCFQYKGTLDVFHKIIRQEGLARLWRGTNAGLALAVPSVGIYLPCYDILRNWLEEYTSSNAPSLTPYAAPVAGVVARSLACITCSPIELARTRMQAFKAFRVGGKPPGMWKTLLGVLSPASDQRLQSYRVLWTGIGAQLARDVPFSAICWATLEPIRRGLLARMGEEANAGSVFGAHFVAAYVAGSVAAAVTCPLDVAKTRRQIEKDPAKALKMTTRQTFAEIWRSGGFKGLFAGVGPRVARAGPSVGIVVSFYELVKRVLHQTSVHEER